MRVRFALFVAFLFCATPDVLAQTGIVEPAIAVTLSPANLFAGDYARATIAIPACRVFQGFPVTRVVQQGRDVQVYIGTKECGDGVMLPYEVLLGPLPEGENSLTLVVDTLPRNRLTFQVAPAVPSAAMAIEPASPVEYEAVQVRLADYCSILDNVTRDGRTYVVTIVAAVCPPGMPVPGGLVGLGRPPAGTYQVILRYKGVAGNFASASFTVAKGAAKIDYSDLWEATAETGWGLTVKQHDLDRIFVVIYAYRADGRPLWLAMTGGEWETPTRFGGAIFRAGGPAVGSAGVATNTRVGTLRVDFDSPQTATATLTREGADTDVPATKTWRITRLAF